MFSCESEEAVLGLVGDFKVRADAMHVNYDNNVRYVRVC